MADGFRCQQFRHKTGRHGMESIVNKECDLEINSKLYSQPMKAHQNRDNVSSSRCKARHPAAALRTLCRRTGTEEFRTTYHIFYVCKSKDFYNQALRNDILVIHVVKSISCSGGCNHFSNGATWWRKKFYII